MYKAFACHRRRLRNVAAFLGATLRNHATSHGSPHERLPFWRAEEYARLRSFRRLFGEKHLNTKDTKVTKVKALSLGVLRVLCVQWFALRDLTLVLPSAPLRVCCAPSRIGKGSLPNPHEPCRSGGRKECPTLPSPNATLSTFGPPSLSYVGAARPPPNDGHGHPRASTCYGHLGEEGGA